MSAPRTISTGASPVPIDRLTRSTKPGRHCPGFFGYVANDPVNKTDPSGNSLTELGFHIYDVGWGISDAAHGASAGELMHPGARLARDRALLDAVLADEEG